MRTNQPATFKSSLALMKPLRLLIAKLRTEFVRRWRSRAAPATRSESRHRRLSIFETRLFRIRPKPEMPPSYKPWHQGVILENPSKQKVHVALHNEKA